MIKCKGLCDSVYHKKCVSKEFQRTQLCEVCLQQMSSIQAPKINIDTSKATVESLLAEVNSKLEIIYETKKKIDELTEAVDFYAEQYQMMLNFKETAEKKMNAIENTNKYLQKCNESLQERIVILEQKEVEKNIEIACLDETVNEDTKKIVEKIAQKLNLNTNQIEDAKRVGREKKEEGRPRPVVVTLRSKSARDEWITRRKTLLINKDIIGNNNTKRVYINENLPKSTRQLLWNAKKMLGDIYKHIWPQNLKVLAKKDDNSKIRWIRSDADINSMCFNNTDSDATQ